MFNRIRDRFGTAGLVVSIMALVFALAGGAFAASGGLNAKQKKQVKAIAKQFAGKPGAAGPAGPAGPAGGNGAAGGAGAAGANGKTVLSGTATPTAGIGTIGDFYMDTDDSKMYGPKAAAGANGGWGSGTALRGADGSPWTAGGTLPDVGTLTGTYGVTGSETAGAGLGQSSMDEGDVAIVPASFSIPVSPAPTFVFVPGPAGAAGYGSNVGAGCPGVVSGVPQADSGKFCVYGFTGFEPPFTLPAADVSARTPSTTYDADAAGVTPAGALLRVACNDGGDFAICEAKGLWAVTGS